jgi:hypothetical protein
MESLSKFIKTRRACSRLPHALLLLLLLKSLLYSFCIVRTATCCQVSEEKSDYEERG